MFRIVKKLNVKEAIKIVKDAQRTEHSKERLTRMEVYNSLFNKNTESIGLFEVDKGHENGKEYHIVYNNRVTKVYNAKSGRFITCLFLRDAQVTRYGLELTSVSGFIQGLNNI